VEAVVAVLHAARRCCDLVVVDLARSLDDVARDVLAACTCALLVVPAEVRATAAAARIAARAELLCRDLRLVVRGPSPSGIPARELEHALGIPLAGDLKAEPRIEVALEEGQPPGSRSRGPLATFCDGLLHDLVGAQPQRRAA
jgi:Flp pilus assembly CpaE family ATPase